jgi:uncharacterized membrane protein YeaQ/YmgE (transglycosylase-associated protein family)
MPPGSECCHHGPPWGLPWQGAEIEIYLWGAIGAVAGWLAGTVMGSRGKVQRLEEVLVGIFGASIGAPVLGDMLQAGKPVPGFTAGALAGAIVGAIALLLLLRVMRGAVGPMRVRKSPTDRRR